MVTLLRLRAAIWLLAVVLGGLISACGAEGMNDDDDDDGDDDPVTYSIGGTVAGLSGTLVLRNNGGNDLSLTANTAFTFTTELANGATYAVTIATEPADQDCVVAHGSGSVSGADVGNVTVTCTDEALPDTPAIVRVTTSVDATVHGSALLFVVAGGDDLTYAWRSVGNDAVLNEGAEPFFLITDLTASDDGNCYTVTASNAGGEAVSDAMCLNVGDVSYDFNENSGAIESDSNVGQLFGNLLLALVGLSTGGPTRPLEAFWEEPGTLDGAAVSASAPIPLGRHTLARNSILITYDFPDEVGVGTMTVHFSGLDSGPGIVNGSVDVVVTRDATGPTSYEDQVIMALRDELSIGGDNGVYKTDVDGYRTLTMQRSGTIGAFHLVTTADVDFQSAAMSFHDVDGFAHIFANATPGILTFNGNGTASGELVVSSSQLGPPDEEVQHCVLVPSGDGIEWELFLD